jgi:DNA invertase Pin-like site-specific DNA recombinase
VSACEQYAALKGYSRIEVVEETFSGAELWDRPQLNRIRERVRKYTEPIDNLPTGQLINYVRGYAAQMEREKIKERSIRGRLAKARSGKVIGLGHDLFGYTLDRKTYIGEKVARSWQRSPYHWPVRRLHQSKKR